MRAIGGGAMVGLVAVRAPARGEVVMQGDRMAIRITEMVEGEPERPAR